MRSKLLIGGLLASVMIIPALAQSNPPASTANPPAAAATAPAPAKVVVSDQWRSSKLIGLNVYNDQNEKLGDINEILLDKSGKVAGVVIGVGGFLGMGEHYVAVSPSSVNVRYDSKNDKWLASMNTTKDALKAAPEFKYPK